MADKWIRFQKDGDKYDLQYRTANDKRVRDTHKALHNVTLPINSRFWDSYYPLMDGAVGAPLCRFARINTLLLMKPTL